MSRTKAGQTAGERTSTDVKPCSSNHPISPAARKFAEYLARRLAPMIEYRAKQQAQVGADTPR